MSLQFSTAVRNAILDVIETTVGASPKLQIRTGAAPANCAAASTGTLLAEITCPSDWMTAAASGSKALQGSWTVAASGTGAAAHYRLMDSSGATCHEQGTVTATGGGGDLTLDNVNINAGQTVTISTKTQTAPGA